MKTSAGMAAIWGGRVVVLAGAAALAVAPLVFRVTDVKDPPLDLASDEMKKLKDGLQRSLADEVVGQYIAKLETEIGTTVNQAAVAQITGANSNN